MKNLSFYLFLSQVFVFQAEALNKVEFLQPNDFNLVKEAVSEVKLKRESKAEEFSATAAVSSAVSHAVLFEDKQPVCVASTVGKPELVPRFMKVADREVKNSGIDLPPCDNFELSLLRQQAREALLINGDKPVQVAALFETIVLCSVSGVGGMGVTVLKNNTAESPSVAGIGLVGVAAVSLPVLMQFSEFAAFTYLRAFSIAGLCGLGTYFVTGYFSGSSEKK